MKREFWLRLLMALSGTACTVIWMQTDYAVSFGVTAVLAAAVLTVLCLKTKLLEMLFAPREKWMWAAAGLLAICTVYNAKSSFFRCCYGWMVKVIELLELPMGQLILRGAPWCVAVLALPMMVGYYLWFVDFFKKLMVRLWKDSDFTEQIFLLGAGCVFGMLIAFTYLCTQGFFGATVNGFRFDFDLIYSADSGYLVGEDVYRNVGATQNDIRQPLFGIFALPFATVAWALSKILFFLPNGYLLISQIIQTVLYLSMLVLLSRMVCRGRVEKILFLLVMCVSFPVIIFVLTAEQYLFAVSWLLLLIYVQEEPEEQTFAFTAATGSLLTSGLLFPLVTWDRDFKTFVKKSFLLCGGFILMLILSGRLTTFLDIPGYIAGYAPYTGVDVDPLYKLRQFVNFAGACLVSPPSGADFTTYSHVSWQMLPVTGWSPVGIAVLVLAVLGAAVSPKDRITKISALWMAFSLLLLGIVGWGTVDNGLTLYTLYFGWAYVAMIFRLTERLLGRWPKVRFLLLAGAIVGLGLWNFNALKDILEFTTQFFPVQG